MPENNASNYDLLYEDEVRILVLQPDRGYQPLVGALETVPLSKYPQYQAISYVWGEPVFPNRITLQRSHQKITKSLADALYRLRDQERPVRLWADALCINQTNSDGRSRQVRLMAHIYSQAQQVLIWLGDGRDSRVAPGFWTLNRLASTEWVAFTDELRSKGSPPPVFVDWLQTEIERSVDARPAWAMANSSWSSLRNKEQNYEQGKTEEDRHGPHLEDWKKPCARSSASNVDGSAVVLYLMVTYAFIRSLSSGEYLRFKADRSSLLACFQTYTLSVSFTWARAKMGSMSTAASTIMYSSSSGRVGGVWWVDGLASISRSSLSAISSSLVGSALTIGGSSLISPSSTPSNSMTRSFTVLRLSFAS
jgi:hypothetical protein